MDLRKAFRDKNCFITGIAGFKGSWLAKLLYELGANVSGMDSDVDKGDSVFNQLDIQKIARVHHEDTRRIYSGRCIRDIKNADYIFHFAAQAIVGEGYKDPRYTFDSNIMGTVSLLEMIKSTSKPVTLLSVASDRVYAPTEDGHYHIESDHLGGCTDPYSVSKVVQNQIIDSYRALPNISDKVTLINARTSNVIGGGDPNVSRLVPSIEIAYKEGKPVELRNPSFTRQYIYVLDCLCSYLYLVAKGTQTEYNIGAGNSTICTVQELVDACKECLPGLESVNTGQSFGFEGSALAVNTDRFHNEFTEVKKHIAEDITEIINRTVKYDLSDSKEELANSLVEEAISIYSV